MSLWRSRSHGGDNWVSPIFDGRRMASAVEAANTITQTYGVTILSINIISAVPADKDLQIALAKGAVASADAERAETVAKGEAKAVGIRAEADAEADRIRARGAKDAADLLSQNEFAVEIAKIKQTGEAIRGSGTSSLFFGADAGNLSGLLSNPSVVKGAGH
jgi:regulator of protease activity HflC (stomatin/prohibitin superfamily)